MILCSSAAQLVLVLDALLLFKSIGTAALSIKSWHVFESVEARETAGQEVFLKMSNS